MQKTHLLISCSALVAWILFGGFVLNAIEEVDEKYRTEKYCSKRQALLELYGDDSEDIEAAERAVTGGSNCRVILCDDVDKESNWSFGGATFFSLTVFTSIGYGNYVPITNQGKGFTMIYALIGFVVFAYVQANVHRMIFALQTAGKKTTFVYLLCLNFSILCCWLFLMAWYYSSFEGWSYGDALWFSYITCTSIGFGDFAPSVKTRDSPLNYIFILGSVLLSGVCVDNLVRMFYIDQIADATVSVNAKIDADAAPEESSCCCWLCNSTYLCIKKPFDVIVDSVLKVFGGDRKRWEWRLYIYALWLGLLVYMFFGGAFFNLIELSGGSTDKATAILALKAMRSSSSTIAADVRNASSTVLEEDIPLTLKSLGRLASSGNVTQAVIAEVQEKVEDLMGLLNAGGTCPVPLPLEEKWSVVNGAMFCMTTFTTIGYGNITPETPTGKVFCVMYSILGFILYAKVESSTVTFLNLGIVAATERFDRLVSKVCCCRFQNLEYFLVAVGSGGFFLIFASAAFMVTEDWDFFSAFWFSFVSCCTIGFGDSTPSFEGWNFIIEGLMLSFGLTHLAMTLHVVAQYSAKWLGAICGSHEKHVGHEEKGAVEGAVGGVKDTIGSGVQMVGFGASKLVL
jgi:hypothetical protein